MYCLLDFMLYVCYCKLCYMLHPYLIWCHCMHFPCTLLLFNLSLSLTLYIVPRLHFIHWHKFITSPLPPSLLLPPKKEYQPPPIHKNRTHTQICHCDVLRVAINTSVFFCSYSHSQQTIVVAIFFVMFCMFSVLNALNFIS